MREKKHLIFIKNFNNSITHLRIKAAILYPWVFVSKPLTAVITAIDTFIWSISSHHTEINELKKAAV